MPGPLVVVEGLLEVVVAAVPVVAPVAVVPGPDGVVEFGVVVVEVVLVEE